MDEKEEIDKIDAVLKQESKNSEVKYNCELEDFINFNDEDVSSPASSDEEEAVTITETIQSTDYESKRQEALKRYQESLKIESGLPVDPSRLGEFRLRHKLTKAMGIHLVQFKHHLDNLLVKIDEEIDSVKKGIALRTDDPIRCKVDGVWKLGHPYFKDSSLFSHPLNQDAFSMLNNKQLSVYDLAPTLKWNKHELTRLKKGIGFQYMQFLKTPIQKEMESIMEYPNPNRQRLNWLSQQLEELRNKDIDCFVPNDENFEKTIDWKKVSTLFFKGKRTDIECKATWDMYMSPRINKGEWTSDETKKLSELAKKHNYQNWDLIVEELGTNRSPLIASLHYYQSQENDRKSGWTHNRFTKEEDVMLLDLIKCYRMGDYIPWAKIVKHFKNRKRPHLFHRWKYYLSKSSIKQGRFTDAEDVLLMILVDKFGENFGKCEQYMPERSRKQLKSRYTINLKQNMKKGKWTLPEDRMILEYVKTHGPVWAPLAKILGRASAPVRHRYHTIQSHMINHPGKKIEEIPRRKHTYCQFDNEKLAFLRFIAKLYEGMPIPSISELEAIIEEKQETYEYFYKQTLVFNLLEDQDQQDDLDDINIDQALIEEFEKNNMHNPKETTHLEAIVNELDKLICTLNINLTIPEDLTNFNLDEVDIEILNRLKLRQEEIRPQNTTRALIPPSINSLKALNIWLQKTLTDKYRYESYDIKTILKNARDEPVIVEELCKKDVQTFFQRFRQLFELPAILSMVKPSINIQPRDIPENFPDEKCYVKKGLLTYASRCYARKDRANNTLRSGISSVASTSNSGPVPLNTSEDCLEVKVYREKEPLTYAPKSYGRKDSKNYTFRSGVSCKLDPVASTSNSEAVFLPDSPIVLNSTKLLLEPSTCLADTATKVNTVPPKGITGDDFDTDNCQMSDPLALTLADKLRLKIQEELNEDLTVKRNHTNIRVSISRNDNTEERKKGTSQEEITNNFESEVKPEFNSDKNEAAFADSNRDLQDIAKMEKVLSASKKKRTRNSDKTEEDTPICQNDIIKKRKIKDYLNNVITEVEEISGPNSDKKGSSLMDSDTTLADTMKMEKACSVNKNRKKASEHYKMKEFTSSCQNDVCENSVSNGKTKGKIVEASKTRKKKRGEINNLTKIPESISDMDESDSDTNLADVKRMALDANKKKKEKLAETSSCQNQNVVCQNYVGKGRKKGKTTEIWKKDTSRTKISELSNDKDQSVVMNSDSDLQDVIKLEEILSAEKSKITYDQPPI